MRDRSIGFALVCALLGCGGRVASATSADGGVDSTTSDLDASVIEPADSRAALDSASDTAPSPVDTMPRDTHTDPPLTCEQALPSSFACSAPTAVQRGGPPTTDCSEGALQAFAAACIAADYGVGAKCADWKAANAACAACIGHWALDVTVIPGTIYPDRDKCWYQLLDSACSTSINCMFACDQAVCGDCDPTSGSSTDGTTSELEECVTRERAQGGTVKPKGVCYDLAAAGALRCLVDNADLVDPCVVKELFSPSGGGGHPNVTVLQRESVVFYRGACRDGGDWSKATSATP